MGPGRRGLSTVLRSRLHRGRPIVRSRGPGLCRLCLRRRRGLRGGARRRFRPLEQLVRGLVGFHCIEGVRRWRGSYTVSWIHASGWGRTGLRRFQGLRDRLRQPAGQQSINSLFRVSIQTCCRRIHQMISSRHSARRGGTRRPELQGLVVSQAQVMSVILTCHEGHTKPESAINPS